MNPFLPKLLLVSVLSQQEKVKTGTKQTKVINQENLTCRGEHRVHGVQQREGFSVRFLVVSDGILGLVEARGLFVLAERSLPGRYRDKSHTEVAGRGCHTAEDKAQDDLTPGLQPSSSAQS